MPLSTADQLHGKVLALQAIISALLKSTPHDKVLLGLIASEVRSLETKLAIANSSSALIEAFKQSVTDIAPSPEKKND